MMVYMLVSEVIRG